MPLDETLALANEIRELRQNMQALQNELSEVNVRRGQLQTLISTLQAQLVTKRTELRQAAQDA